MRARVSPFFVIEWSCVALFTGLTVCVIKVARGRRRQTAVSRETSRRPNRYVRMEDRTSFLLEAAARGHYRQVKFFIDAGYDLDAADQDGNTALILSVTRVKENVIRNRLIVLLLQGGADPNGSDRHGFTPLMHGILLRHIDSVRLLSDSKRLDYSAEDMNGNTALMHAAKIGLAEVVSLILTQLSAVHRVICLGQKNRSGLTACDIAERAGHKTLASLLSWKSPFYFPGRASVFASPRELDGEEQMFLTTGRQKDFVRTTRDSPYFTGSSVLLSSDESIKDSPAVALPPGPLLRRYRVQNSVIGIEPIPYSASPIGNELTRNSSRTTPMSS